MRAISRFWWFLAPGLVQSGISVLMLPLSTYVLGPADFGFFALLSALAGFLGVIASFGSSYLLSAHFPTLDEEQRGRLISSLVCAGLTTGALLGTLLVAGWPWFGSLSTEFGRVGRSYIALSVLAMLLTVPWYVAVDVIRLDGRAHFYAAVLVTQSLASAAALLGALFYFELGVASLFVAAVSGAFVLCIGAMITLGHRLTLLLDARWLKEMVNLGTHMVVAHTAESVHQVLERSVLSVRSGLGELGIYSHSQQYRNIVDIPISAIANSAWPVTLAEARKESTDFVHTRLAWNTAHLLLTAAGLALATLGPHLISLLTHDKFTEAYILATLWVVFLLVRYTGRAQTGLFYARGAGASYARIQAFSMVIGTLLLFLFVPLFGIYGAFLSAVSQQAVLRLGVHWRSQQIQRVPFQDQWAVFGAVLISVTLWVQNELAAGLQADIGLLAAAMAILAISAHRPIAETYARLVNASHP